MWINWNTARSLHLESENVALFEPLQNKGHINLMCTIEGSASLPYLPLPPSLSRQRATLLVLDLAFKLPRWLASTSENTMQIHETRLNYAASLFPRLVVLVKRPKTDSESTNTNRKKVHKYRQYREFCMWVQFERERERERGRNWAGISDCLNFHYFILLLFFFLFLFVLQAILIKFVYIFNMFVFPWYIINK